MPKKKFVMQAFLERQEAKSFACLRDLKKVRDLDLEVTVSIRVSVLDSLDNQIPKLSYALVLDHIKRNDVARHKPILNVQRMNKLQLHLKNE